MTEPDGKFEEEIRRALCTAGDLVVPAGDGLHKIRERTVDRPNPLAWLSASAAHVLGRPLVWLRVAGSEIVATARGHSSLRPVLRSAKDWPGLMRAALRSPRGWLHPVLAAVAAVVIVLGVALAIPRLRGPLTASFAGASQPGQAQGGGQNGGGPPGAGAAQSSGASRLPVSRPVPGQPYDATIGPGSLRCGVRHLSSVTPFVPPAQGPGPSQSITAGLASPTGNAAGMGTAASRGFIQTASCTRTTGPTMSPSSSPSASPSSSPSTSPSSSPSTSPSSSPSTTPPTSTPPASPTNSAAPFGSPTGSASPG